MRYLLCLSALWLFAGCTPAGPETCDNGADDDGDGFVDCGDQDCWESCGERCGNGVDDDADGYVDCADPDCAASCPVPCADGSCVEVCDNGIDDDGDYLVDCADELDCRVVCDADGDGWLAEERGGADCDDADPAVHPGATEAPYDGQDDDCDPATPDDDLDGDGFLLAEDCDDGSALVYPGAAEVCGDGVVDDCDATGTPPRWVCYGDRSLGTADAVLQGTSTDDYTGFAVAGAGDVDGDGRSDLLVGAYGEGSNSIGAVYVVRSPVVGTFDLSLADAKLVGESEDDWTGYAVSSAGDPNGNGQADILVGAQYDDATGNNAGAVYLLRGSITGDVLLSDADAKILGASANDLAGYAVAGAGDVDGDGLDDFLIGAIQNELGGHDAGAAYVVYGGAEGTVLLAFAPITLTGEGSNHSAGCALDGGGDVDGDGLADVVVGACSADRPGAENSGAAYLHTGLVDGTYGLGSGTATYLGPAADDRAGSAVALAGDVDGDGLTDVLVGVPGHDGVGLDGGAALLFHGTDLSVADVTLLGEAAGDEAGGAVDGAGDVDGDGVADLLVGGAGADAAGTDAGLAWVVFGPVTGTLDLSAADVRITGAAPYDFAGDAVSGVGDTNGDGFDDVLVGAPFADTSVPSAGAAYLLSFGY